MPISNSYKRYLRVIDAVVDEVAEELAEKGESYSCHKGCSHCCHMYVETTWDEAIAMAEWIRDKPESERERFTARVEAAATERMAFFRKRNQTQRYAAPTRHHKDMPDEYNREYFYSESRPCPLLEDNICSAYEARPSACRLHVVTSQPTLCSRETPDDSDVVIPDEFEKKQERVEAIAEEYLSDSRWGELSVMLHHALQSFPTQQNTEDPRPDAQVVGE